MSEQQQDHLDIMLWADGTWCYREEYHEMTHMSDDVRVIPFASPEWNKYEHS